METENQNPHIGQIVKDYIIKKRIFKSALARKIEKRDADIIRYQKSKSLQTSVLLQISHALQHNFFADIAALLPKEFSTDAPQDTTKDERIAQLEQEILILKSQLEVLKEVMQKS